MPTTNILSIIPINKPTHALKKVIKTAINSADAISEFFLGIAIATYAQAKPVNMRVRDKAICIKGFIKVMNGKVK
jgi:hypothetical protein